MTAAREGTAAAVRYKPNKRFDTETLDLFVAVLPNNVSLSEFFAGAGVNCVCLERFVYVKQTQQTTPTPPPPTHFIHHRDREIVYFTGNVNPSVMAALRIRHRPGFRREVRRSNVLILSIKGGRDLGLDDALQIVRLSGLHTYLDRILTVAVPPRPGANANAVSHIYVQFASEEAAQLCVNVVDALPYKGLYVHSPQLDLHGWATLRTSPDADDRTWYNPLYLREPGTPAAADAETAAAATPTTAARMAGKAGESEGGGGGGGVGGGDGANIDADDDHPRAAAAAAAPAAAPAAAAAPFCTGEVNYSLDMLNAFFL